MGNKKFLINLKRGLEVNVQLPNGATVIATYRDDVRILFDNADVTLLSVYCKPCMEMNVTCCSSLDEYGVTTIIENGFYKIKNRKDVKIFGRLC